jgi:hypothetical protein
MNKPLSVFLLVAILVSAIASCSVSKDKVAVAPKSGAPSGTVVLQAMVNFVSGSVQVQRNGDWVELKEGDTVSRDSIVRTGKGAECDLQFEKLGALHLRADTMVLLKNIDISSLHRHVDVGLTAGSVVAKVSKLTERDRFQVQTNAVVCGVRGTRFLVTKIDEDKTLIAVAEGKVALIPSSFDPQKIESRANSLQGQLLVQEVEQRVMQDSVSVDIGSESVVSLAAMQKPSETIARLQDTVFQTLQTQTKGTSSTPSGNSESSLMPTSIEETFTDYEETTRVQAPAVPQAQTTTTRKILDETVNLQIRGASLSEQPTSQTTTPQTTTSLSQQPLTVPVLLSPGDGKKVDINTSATLWFSWNAVPGAATYEVSLYKGKTKAGTAVRTWMTAKTSVSLTQFTDLSLGDFVWEVVAIGDSDGSTNSPPADASFQLVKGTTLTAPSVQLPQN